MRLKASLRILIYRPKGVGERVEKGLVNEEKLRKNSWFKFLFQHSALPYEALTEPYVTFLEATQSVIENGRNFSYGKQFTAILQEN